MPEVSTPRNRTIGTRPCRRCGYAIPWTDRRCKPCRDAYRRAHLEEFVEYQRTYQKAHPERVNAKNRRIYAKDPEPQKARVARYQGRA